MKYDYPLPYEHSLKSDHWYNEEWTIESLMEADPIWPVSGDNIARHRS